MSCSICIGKNSVEQILRNIRALEGQMVQLPVKLYCNKHFSELNKKLDMVIK